MEVVFASLLVIVTLAFSGAVGIFTWRQMTKGLPPAALREGRKNLPFMFWIFAVFAAVVLAVSFLFDVRFSQAGMLVAAATIPVCAIWQLVSFFRGNAMAGALLLDCGPYPKRKATNLMAAGMFCYFFIAGFVNLIDGSKIQGGVAIVLSFSGFGLAFVANGRLQFREHGIWAYASLIDWDRIKSYRWEGEALVIAQQTPFRIARGVLSVPAEVQPSADEILKHHVTAAASSS